MNAFVKGLFLVAFPVALATLAALTTGCSDYNKVLKSTDLDYKYERALGYLDSNKCLGALPILEELAGLTRGTEKQRDVQYHYAQAHFCVADYYLSRYYLKQFSKTFPHDPRSEQAQFQAAVCSFRLSPSYSLDQSETHLAIEELQLFLDRYPASANRDSSQAMMDGLRYKLESKSFEAASQYHRTGQYKAATIALENGMHDFPDSPYREQMEWLILDSYYQYAILSTERRKLERFNDAIEAFLTFAARFPDSSYRAEAERVQARCIAEIEKLGSDTPAESP
jgi:outer membrane protein assembly factor BamD